MKTNICRRQQIIIRDKTTERALKRLTADGEYKKEDQKTFLGRICLAREFLSFGSDPFERVLPRSALRRRRLFITFLIDKSSASYVLLFPFLCLSTHLRGVFVYYKTTRERRYYNGLIVLHRFVESVSTKTCVSLYNSIILTGETITVSFDVDR